MQLTGLVLDIKSRLPGRYDVLAGPPSAQLSLLTATTGEH